MVKKLKLNESETKTLDAMMRAVRNRINELEDEYVDESLCESDEEVWEEFDALAFNPNSSWNDIWSAVIGPIIDDHFAHIGIDGYTQQEAEDDIDALINIFMDEYGDEYPNVKEACLRFFDGDRI